MIKLNEIRPRLGFCDSKTSRNFADWLRDARTENDFGRVDGELAYKEPFIRGVLNKKLELIKRKYPVQHESVLKFLNNEHTETEPESTIDPTGNELETNNGIDPVINEPERLPELETETKPIQPEPETESEPEVKTVTVTGNPATESKFRRILTNPETMLWGTLAVILVFLPFTVLNLYQYISIETGSAWGDWGVFLLCCGIAFVWDVSILLFAVNGKETMSKIGAGVLFVFMASKFDFFARVFNFMGADGETVQLMLVISAIVFYSPILIHQYTKLSVKNE